MAVTRRLFVSGAVAAPLLGQLGGTAAAAADPAFTVLNGMTELRATEPALTRLAAEGIAIQAVEPAVPVSDGGTVVGVRMAPEYATGAVALTGRPGAGSGRLLGGVVLVSRDGARMEATGIRGSLPDNRVFAFLKVNDQWVGEVPLYTGDASAVRLSVQPGAPGKPTVIKGSGIPMTPTQEGLDAFADTFGTGLFSPTDVVFTATGEGNAWPLPVSPIGQRVPLTHP